jgi:hypothetical protein
LRNRLQMLWVHARRGAAQVIEYQSFADRAYQHLIDPPVSEVAALADDKLPIPSWKLVSPPEPAGFCEVGASYESFERVNDRVSHGAAHSVAPVVHGTKPQTIDDFHAIRDFADGFWSSTHAVYYTYYAY